MTASPPFPWAAATGADGTQAAAACARALAGTTGGVGFLYATSACIGELEAMVATLREATGVAHWVGAASTAIVAGDTEHYEGCAVAVLVADLPAECRRLFGPCRSPGEVDALERALEPMGGAPLAIVHGDPRNPALPRLVRRLAHGPGVGMLAGGLTAGEGEHRQLVDLPAEGGLSGIALGPGVPVATALTHSCVPIGGRHVVTDCRHNVLIRIDGRPALDVFREAAGDLVLRQPERAAGHIFVGLVDPTADEGDYVVRHLVGIDTRHRLLAVAAEVEPGDGLIFLRRDGAAAHAGLATAAEAARRRLGTAPRGGLYFTCTGRGRALFGTPSTEAAALAEALGDVPVVGMFSAGEIHRDRLHGYTGVLVLFG